MQIKAIPTLPLAVFSNRAICTQFVTGAKDIIGFGIKGIDKNALIQQSQLHNFQFLLFDLFNEQCIFYSFNLVEQAVVQVKLSYDQKRDRWFFGMSGNTLAVQALSTIDITEQQVYLCSENNISGEKDFIDMWVSDHNIAMLFSVPDDGEIEDDKVYLTTWNITSQQCITQSIGSGVLAHAYISRTTCFLFTFQRCWSAFSQSHGDWICWGYIIDKSNLKQKTIMLPALSIAIKNVHMPLDDFGTRIDVRMSACAGFVDEVNRQDSCVLVVAFEQIADNYGVNRTIEGGLYHINSQGKLLHYTSFPFGASINMCNVAGKIIGTDILGEYRLWTWLPENGAVVDVKQYLSDEVKNVSLLSFEGSEIENDLQVFWCIEEYEQDIRVTLRDTNQFEVYDEIWLYKMKPVYSVNNPFLVKQMIPVMLAIKDKMCILVIDENRQMQVVQIF